MPLSGEAKREYQRRKMAERRAGLTPGLTSEPETVRPDITDVRPGSLVRPATGMTRQELRDQLDVLKWEYGVHQRAMNWEACKAVNARRDPLFQALWVIERHEAPESRYWMPARFQNEGQTFAAKRAT